MDFSRFDDFPPEEFTQKFQSYDLNEAWIQSLTWDELKSAYCKIRQKMEFEKRQSEENEVLYKTELAGIREIQTTCGRQEYHDKFAVELLNFSIRQVRNEIYGNKIYAQLRNAILDSIYSDN